MPLRWSHDGRDWPWRDTSRFVKAAGVTWHVQHLPRPGALTVLLLHGTGASTHSWRALMPLLAARCTVLAVDLPGHGFSTPPTDFTLFGLPGMAKAVAALMDTLGEAPALLVGHSAGAAVAVRMGLDAQACGRPWPRAIAGINAALLPLPGWAGTWFSPIARVLARSAWVPRLFAWRARDPAVLRRLLDGTGSRLDAQGRALYGRLLADPDHAAAALAMMARWDLQSLAAGLGALRLPLWLVVGAGDATLPPSQAEAVRRRLPQAHVERLEGLGHLAHEEAPEAVAARLLAIIDEMSIVNIA